jgi:hypothetical protein
LALLFSVSRSQSKAKDRFTPFRLSIYTLQAEACFLQLSYRAFYASAQVYGKADFFALKRGVCVLLCLCEYFSKSCERSLCSGWFLLIGFIPACASYRPVVESTGARYSVWKCKGG